MDQAFGWIGDLIRWIARFFPRLIIVPTTDAGVAFVRGRIVKEWRPGLHWYLPVTTKYRVMPVVRQTVSLQTKGTMTEDKRSVFVGGLVTYTVSNVVTALTQVADLPSDVIERSLPAILGLVESMTLEEIHTNRSSFNTKLTESIRKNLRGYGVEVEDAQLTEFGPCRTINAVGHMALGHNNLWPTI